MLAFERQESFRLLYANIPRLLQISPRVALKGHQGMRFDNRWQSLHMRGDDLGEILIVLETQEGHKVIFARDRIYLRHSVDLQQVLGGLVDLSTLHINQDYRSYHTNSSFLI